MNLTTVLASHGNTSWWANWLLNGRRDETGNIIPLAEGRYLVSNIEKLFLCFESKDLTIVYTSEK